MWTSILNNIIPGRKNNNHRKKVEPKFVFSAPVLIPGNELRRLSTDSSATTAKCTLPSEVPIKQKIFNKNRRQSLESSQFCWINGSQISSFPPGTQTEILKSFVATVDDEVSVPQGSLVSAMYKDSKTGQWIYVKRADGQHGYVPDTICSLLVTVSIVDDHVPGPEKPKISRKKSQQIKRELKKFHKREFEKRAEALFASGLITLERARPRRMPTAAERQFAMNENLRRFLSSLPEFPVPPEELDDDRPEPKLLDSEDSKPVAEGKNIIFEAKSGSQPNLNKFYAENNDDGQEKLKNQRSFSASFPDFDAEFGLIASKPKPPPKNSTATLLRLQNESKTLKPKRRTTTLTTSLARTHKWRPAEPIIHDLVVIQDFRAETKIDLDVRRGDRLTTVFNSVNGWIWATHLRTKNQGFVPNSVVMLASEFS
uniref:SH3 domain-containing protein n=1 Tax=Panagrolaimus sp. JU765 TaxID=591449 RepID=A0AC34RD35_9BILA